MKTLLFLSMFTLIFSFSLSLNQEKTNHAIEAIVFNKTDQIITIDQIDDFERYQENISFYARLNQIFDQNIEIEDRTGRIVAEVHQPLEGLTLGKTYLFHGYVVADYSNKQIIIESIEVE